MRMISSNPSDNDGASNSLKTLAIASSGTISSCGRVLLRPRAVSRETLIQTPVTGDFARLAISINRDLRAAVASVESTQMTSAAD